MTDSKPGLEVDVVSCCVEDGVFHLRAWALHWRKRVTHLSIATDAGHAIESIEFHVLPAQARGIEYRTLGFVEARGTLQHEPSVEECVTLTFTAINFTFKNGEQQLDTLDVETVVRLDSLPPDTMRRRVGFKPTDQGFVGQGMRLCQRLLGFVKQHGDLDNCQNVLDWGCGCGRITRHMLRRLPAASIAGCDIDGEAVRWMQEHFSRGSFRKVGAYPPTQFDDQRFDFVYGVSVFTHLDEETQLQWLGELRRITRAGGLVIMSVRSTPSDEAEAAGLSDKGFFDRQGPIHRQFAEIAEADYYRLTVHSKDYVVTHWSKYFDVLEVVERGLGRQDAVVMRRR